MKCLLRRLACLGWLPSYGIDTASRDLLAAVVVTLLLIPQGLAYALLAGLPPILGLYASILPLLAYALLGSSRTLAVGPAAVLSLMNVAVLEPLFPLGSPEFVAASALLALMSGVILLAMASLRLGFLANFLSHPVVEGFVSAAAILIALSQVRHLLGISASGQTLPQLVTSLWAHLAQINGATVLLALISLGLLWALRRYLREWLLKRGCRGFWVDTLVRAVPAITLVLATLLTAGLGLDRFGVIVVGDIPAGLPALSWPEWDLALLQHLLPAAVLISLVSFVESVSIGYTLAARRRERLNPDQELVGLGVANLAASLSGGLAVTASFSRSAVNHDAGARTQMAGVFTALGITLGLLSLTSLLYYLPQATLAAIIILSVVGLVNLRSVLHTWRFSWRDGLAQAATLVGVLCMGIEQGLLMGVSLSLVLFLWRTSRPHIAVIGQLPGSEHFRNVERFPQAVLSPSVLSLRVDESLFFPNARYLEEQVGEHVAGSAEIGHVVLMCSGVNLIDASALESLTHIAERLHMAGIQLHLSEVKGPVMDQLKRAAFLQYFGGQVFVSHYTALQQLDPETTLRTRKPA